MVTWYDVIFLFKSGILSSSSYFMRKFAAFSHYIFHMMAHAFLWIFDTIKSLKSSLEWCFSCTVDALGRVDISPIELEFDQMCMFCWILIFKKTLSLLFFLYFTYLFEITSIVSQREVSWVEEMFTCKYNLAMREPAWQWQLTDKLVLVIANDDEEMKRHLLMAYFNWILFREN